MNERKNEQRGLDSLIIDGLRVAGKYMSMIAAVAIPAAVISSPEKTLIGVLASAFAGFVMVLIAEELD